jgi:hypothetical protein
VGSKFTLKLPIKSPFSIDPQVTASDIPMLPPEAD